MDIQNRIAAAGFAAASVFGLAVVVSPTASAADLVGPGCGAYAAANPSGPASVDGMSQAPVAVAASNNPQLTTLTMALSGQLNPQVNLVDTLNNAQNKKTAGFLQPTIYTSKAKSSFNDITQGNNGAFSAKPGWDAATGLGGALGGGLGGG